MKITRFPQSCLLIETNNKKILIDPGSIDYDQKFLKKDWADINIILVTHKHSDHCYPKAILEIMKNKKTKLYTTREVADAYPELSPEIVKAGDILKFNNIKAEVTQAVHGYVPLLKGGKEINENVGYIIDDGKTRAYQTSDTICFPNNYKCDILFVPVVNHGVVMGPWEASLFAKETEARLVVPIHYSNPKHSINVSLVKKEFETQKLNYKFIEIGETIEI